MTTPHPLNEERRLALGSMIREWFEQFDDQDKTVLRTLDYCDSRTIDMLIDEAIAPAISDAVVCALAALAPSDAAGAPIYQAKIIVDPKWTDVTKAEFDNYGSMGGFDTRIVYAAPVAPAAPKLAVWYGAMPESNGKSNWTAILYRKSEGLFGGLAEGITLARSEYPDRVRYEADRARWLIGELTEQPFILDYDADKHSGYVKPVAPAAVAPSMARDDDFVLVERGLLGAACAAIDKKRDAPVTLARLREAAMSNAAPTPTVAAGLRRIGYATLKNGELLYIRIGEPPSSFAEGYSGAPLFMPTVAADAAAPSTSMSTSTSGSVQVDPGAGPLTLAIEAPSVKVIPWKPTSWTGPYFHVVLQIESDAWAAETENLLKAGCTRVTDFSFQYNGVQHEISYADLHTLLSARAAQPDERAAFEWPVHPKFPSPTIRHANGSGYFTEHQMQHYANEYGELVRAALAADASTPVLAAEQINAIMEQAQVFASAWSLVGGRFDVGKGLETAEQEKANLRAMLSASIGGGDAN